MLNKFFSNLVYQEKKRKMSENGKINRIFWFVVSYFIKEQCEYVNVNFEKQTCKFTDNRYNTFRRNRKKIEKKHIRINYIIYIITSGQCSMLKSVATMKGYYQETI